MSISSRIWEMNNHLLADYEVLTLAGADLTNVDKNILNLKPTWKERLLYFMNNGTDIVWNNWNKVTGSGTTLSLNNTEEAPMSLTYKGNTSQNGTPTPSSPIPVQVVSGDNSIEVVGKNLFNPSEVIANQLTTISNDNITITDNSGWGRGHIICGDKIKAGTYTISTIGNNAQLIVMARGYINNEVYTSLISGGAFYSAYYQATTFGTTTNNIIAITLPNTCDYYYIGFALGSNGTETFKVQLEKGNQATTYEEYKSASYPITLPEGMFLGWIGTYQDKIDKSTGKNLFDKNTMVLNGYINTTGWALTSEANLRTAYIQCKPNTTYTITKILSARFAVASYSSLNFGTIGENGYIGNNETRVVTTTSANAKYLCVFYYHTNDTLSEETIRNSIMIQEGDITTPVYEPYGTGWYLKKEIGKVVLDGSENWNVGTRSDNTTKFFYRIYNEILTNNTGVGNEYSNYFRIENPYTSLNDSMWMFKQGNVTALRLGFSNQDIITEAGLQSWLSTHNTDLYYPLATPTYEYITDSTLISQLEAMKQSYDSQTNISQTNNDLPFELSVVALSNE